MPNLCREVLSYEGTSLGKDHCNEALFLCIPTCCRLPFLLAPDSILHRPCHMEERNDAVLIRCHKNMKCCLCDRQSRLEVGISTLGEIFDMLKFVFLSI